MSRIVFAVLVENFAEDALAKLPTGDGRIGELVSVTKEAV